MNKNVRNWKRKEVTEKEKKKQSKFQRIYPLLILRWERASINNERNETKRNEMRAWNKRER